MNAYPYGTGNLLEDRNSYFYSAFIGFSLFSSWKRQRDDALKSLLASSPLLWTEGPTDRLIVSLQFSLARGDVNSAEWLKIDKLMQRFEVSKRMHREYGTNWRPTNPADYYSMETYLRFAELMDMAYKSSTKLQYLNTFLKSMDTLTALVKKLDLEQRDRIDQLILHERANVGNLALKLGIPFTASLNAKAYEKKEGQKVRYAESNQVQLYCSQDELSMNTTLPQQLKGVVLLAAQTARSQAYIQIMVASGLLPESVILLGEPDETVSEEVVPLKSWNDILLPNLNESVFNTCKRADVNVIILADNDVNMEASHRIIFSTAPDIVIYSGVNGQIVSERTLALGPKFLHMHSGWLPMYRGSTTLYYTQLEGKLPGVSAIFLEPRIDTGPVLARRQYPRPPAGMDLDLVYDTAIRADLMVRVLLNYKERGTLSAIEHQNPSQGTPYYVIHPILKHLSILSLEKHKHT